MAGRFLRHDQDVSVKRTPWIVFTHWLNGFGSLAITSERRRPVVRAAGQRSGNFRWDGNADGRRDTDSRRRHQRTGPAGKPKFQTLDRSRPALEGGLFGCFPNCSWLARRLCVRVPVAGIIQFVR